MDFEFPYYFIRQRHKFVSTTSKGSVRRLALSNRESLSSFLPFEREMGEKSGISSPSCSPSPNHSYSRSTENNNIIDIFHVLDTVMGCCASTAVTEPVMTTPDKATKRMNPAVLSTPKERTPLEQITTPSTAASMSPGDNKPMSDHSRLLFALDDSHVPSSPQRQNQNDDDVVPVDDACIFLQSHIRTFLVRKRYKAALQAIVILQRWFLLLLSMKQRQQQEEPNILTNEIEDLKNQKFAIAVLKLQALVRGVLQRQRAIGVQESQTLVDEPTVDLSTTPTSKAFDKVDDNTMAVPTTNTPTNDAAGVFTEVPVEDVGILMEMDNDKGGDDANPVCDIDDHLTKSAPDKEDCASDTVLLEGAVVPVNQSESADHQHGDFDQVSSTTGHDLGTTNALAVETNHIVTTTTEIPNQSMSLDSTVSSQTAFNVDDGVKATIEIKDLDNPAEGAKLTRANGPDSGNESDHVEADHNEKPADDIRIPSDATDATIHDPASDDTNKSDDSSLENIWSIVAATPMQDPKIEPQPKRSARSKATPESTALAIGFFKQDCITADDKDAAGDHIGAGSSVEPETIDAELQNETADSHFKVESKTIPDGLLEIRDVSAPSEVVVVHNETETPIETSANEGVPSSVPPTTDTDVRSARAHEDHNETQTSTESSSVPSAPPEEGDAGTSPVLLNDKVALNGSESAAEAPTGNGVPGVLPVSSENNESATEGLVMPIGEGSDLPIAPAEEADEDVNPALADDCVVLHGAENTAVTPTEDGVPIVLPALNENNESAFEGQVMPLGERSDSLLTPADEGASPVLADDCVVLQGADTAAETPSDEGPIVLPANDENNESSHEVQVTPLGERSNLPPTVAEESSLAPAEELDQDVNPAPSDECVVLNVTASAAEPPTYEGIPIVLPTTQENNDSANEAQEMPLVERSDLSSVLTEESKPDVNLALSDDSAVLSDGGAPVGARPDEGAQSAAKTPNDKGVAIVLPTTHENDASACANEQLESLDEDTEVDDPSISNIASSENEQEVPSNQRNTGRSVQFSPDTPTTTKATKSPVVTGRKSPKSPLQSLISRFDAGGSAFKTGLIYPPSAPTLSHQSPGVDTTGRLVNVEGSVQSKNATADAEIAKLRQQLQEQQLAEQQKIEEHRLEREKVEKRNRELEEQLANLKTVMEEKEAQSLEAVTAAGDETLGSSLEVPVPPAPTKEEGAKPEGNEIQSTQISRTTTPEQQQTLMEESGRMLE